MFGSKLILLIFLFFTLYANDDSYFEATKANIGKPTSEVAKFYAKACLENNPTACAMLNAMIVRTKDGKRDYIEAAKFYKKACDGGEVIGCSILAGMYTDGKGIEQNKSKAVQLYTKACSAQEATGCTVLGMMYANGRSVDQNYTKSIDFFKQGCDNGSALGCKSLLAIYKKGIGLEKNQEDENELIERASILDLYEDVYSQLVEGEKEYLADNYKLIRRITQDVLNRYAHSRIPSDVIENDKNMIEFYLHPDGSISDIHFNQKSKISIFNDTTRETIEIAYSKYPRPKQKTLIRYRVNYDLKKNETKKEK